MASSVLWLTFFQGERDPYTAAKEMGIFTVIESPRNMTTSTIIQRILTNHEAYKVLISVFLLIV
jgi:ethanolamine-phosphate cytidylyltransferase